MGIYSTEQLQGKWKDARERSARDGTDLRMRGYCNPRLDTTKIRRADGDFDVSGRVCVICRKTKERWLFPYGLAFSQWANAWGNDYKVFYAVTGDGMVQFQEDGRRWPQELTGYFAVNYEGPEVERVEVKVEPVAPALTKSQKRNKKRREAKKLKAATAALEAKP